MSLQILNIKNDCTGCGACISACPQNALSLTYNQEGFYFPKLDSKKCIDCKICEKVCHCIHVAKPKTPLLDYKAFMIKAKDSSIVKNSSSGGVFSLLSDKILKEGGVVYGARYNFQLERLEQCSSDECTMQELRKSKYIESYMGKIIFDVAKKLKDGRKVMFCGTPCQVSGLKHYLVAKKISMSNLLLVRFICHGVPSNKFFTEYKHYEEDKYKSKMQSFDFRPKYKGWRFSEWKMNFINGKEVLCPYKYSYYYYLFQESNILRSSCYSCNRIFDNETDITIGDFWGINKYRPENKDQDGISVMLIHNEKGMEFLTHIKNYSYLEEIPLSSIDYIYKEIRWRSDKFIERNKIMDRIIKKGYIKVAKKTLKLKIFKYRVYLFLSMIKQKIRYK